MVWVISKQGLEQTGEAKSGLGKQKSWIVGQIKLERGIELSN